MMWLNDVKSRGGTAFIHPNKELLLEPRKGSMAYWINTKANTNKLKETIHGGCPVFVFFLQSKAHKILFLNKRLLTTFIQNS